MTFLKGNSWSHLVQRPLSALLPNHCYLCGDKSYEFLCTGCHDDLPRIASGCSCCGLPLPDQAQAGQLCGDCLIHPKPFTRTLAAFRYAHPVDFLINRFKHHRHLMCGDYLSKHLLAGIRRSYERDTCPDALLPIPLHWTRKWIRGFNQTDLIAYQLRRHLHIPVVHSCRRDMRNPRQQGLGRKERLRNLHQAFSVTDSLEGRHIALVDDVMTTGATVTELARQLQESGARRVDVWVLARVS